MHQDDLICEENQYDDTHDQCYDEIERLKAQTKQLVLAARTWLEIKDVPSGAIDHNEVEKQLVEAIKAWDGEYK